MDDKIPTPMTTGTSASSAETLRSLQQRARAALEAQRARMGQLEAQLTDQLDTISATISEQLSEHSVKQQEADQTGSQISLLQQELADVKAAWAREREQAANDAANRAQLFEKQRAEVEKRTEDLAVGRRDLETRQLALDDRATQLNAQEREQRRIKDELEARVQDLARQQAEFLVRESILEQSRADIAARESKLLSSEQSLTAREESLTARQEALTTRENALLSNREQTSRDQADFAIREQSWQLERTALETERDRARAQLETAVAENQAQGGELAAQLAETRRQLAAQQIAWENEHANTESELLALQNRREAAMQERDALTEKLANLTDQSQSTSAQFVAQIADLQQQLEFQASDWQGERSQIEAKVLALSSSRDELSTALTAAAEQLETSRHQSDAAAERDELQQKFELAISDMQRLRGRVAELEADLQTRPATDQTDSVEVVHLRAERDELAHRITELERQPAIVVDADMSQQIADLQRRFELAVEDVRDLKKQNAQLEAQVVAAKSAPVAAANPTAGNWESVKKQLLASLEGESCELSPGREKERASIENTVRITDEVVSNKDRQIAELKTKLAGGGNASSSTAATAEVLDVAVDSDAVIQKHRARIAHIEQEMEDKLRTTEMQLSLERAKIAREQAQLTELRIELESMRGPNGSVGEVAENAPKRRWLSKLGLGDEDKK